MLFPEVIRNMFIPIVVSPIAKVTWLRDEQARNALSPINKFRFVEICKKKCYSRIIGHKEVIRRILHKYIIDLYL